MPGPVDCMIDDIGLFCCFDFGQCVEMAFNDNRHCVTVRHCVCVCVCVYGSSLLSGASIFTLMIMHAIVSVDLCGRTI